MADGPRDFPSDTPFSIAWSSVSRMWGKHWAARSRAGTQPRAIRPTAARGHTGPRPATHNSTVWLSTASPRLARSEHLGSHSPEEGI